MTKRNMANAVSSMTKHLEQVQTSLAVSLTVTSFFPSSSRSIAFSLVCESMECILIIYARTSLMHPNSSASNVHIFILKTIPVYIFII